MSLVLSGSVHPWIIPSVAWSGRGEMGESGIVLAYAGAILLVSGILLDVVTPNNGPWIGTWLNDVFGLQWWIGLGIMGSGILSLVLDALGLKGSPLSEIDVPRGVSREQRNAAIAQRFYSPGYPPKPDWGQTLRGLGLFAVLVAAGWYLAGAPPIAGYELNWMRDGFDAYGMGVLILYGTIVAWSVLTIWAAASWFAALLESSVTAVWWLLRQVALVIGALVLALITGAGVNAFGG